MLDLVDVNRVYTLVMSVFSTRLGPGGRDRGGGREIIPDVNMPAYFA